MRPIAVVFLAWLAGCAAGNSQIATCQAEKDQLLATIRTQREANRDLNAQVASLEARLDQAEKVLAQKEGAPRFSKASAQPPAAEKAATLAWRMPEAEAGNSPAPRGRANGGDSQLRELARRDGRVKYDAQTGTARVDLPLAFRDQSATLTAEDKLRLDEAARLLRSNEARELQIVVFAKEKEHAQAVADYLDRHGIARERLVVSDERVPDGDQGGSRVALGLLPPESAMASGSPSTGAKRR
jgi:outer membrane protein OmpA-like peptidoglycan-associated protein